MENNYEQVNQSQTAKGGIFGEGITAADVNLEDFATVIKSCDSIAKYESNNLSGGDGFICIRDVQKFRDRFSEKLSPQQKTALNTLETFLPFIEDYNDDEFLLPEQKGVISGDLDVLSEKWDTCRQDVKRAESAALFIIDHEHELDRNLDGVVSVADLAETKDLWQHKIDEGKPTDAVEMSSLQTGHNHLEYFLTNLPLKTKSDLAQGYYTPSDVCILLRRDLAYYANEQMHGRYGELADLSLSLRPSVSGSVAQLSKFAATLGLAEAKSSVFWPSIYSLARMKQHPDAKLAAFLKKYRDEITNDHYPAIDEGYCKRLTMTLDPTNPAHAGDMRSIAIPTHRSLSGRSPAAQMIDGLFGANNTTINAYYRFRNMNLAEFGESYIGNPDEGFAARKSMSSPWSTTMRLHRIQPLTVLDLQLRPDIPGWRALEAIDSPARDK